MVKQEYAQTLWGLVIPHAQNPFPPPLSRPPRSAIRQGVLANLCRVSRLFQSIAEKILYSHVITDDPSRFLHPLHSPSKRHQLAMVRSLRFEYSEKGREPSYETTFHSGQSIWAQYGRSKKAVDDAIVVDCENEVEGLIRSLDFTRDEAMARKVLPRLETIAIAAIYGKEDDRWRRYDTKHTHDGSFAPPSNDCGARFDQFLHCLNLRHLCIRDPNGPLSLPLITYASTLPHIGYSRTVHFDADIDELRIPFGTKIRYISDAPLSTEWQTVSSNLAQGFFRIIELRKYKRTVDGRYRDPKDPLDLEIYASTSVFAPETFDEEDLASFNEGNGGAPMAPFTTPGRIMAPADQKRLASDMAVSTQALFRQNSGLKDIVRWYPSHESPKCQACGSGPPA